ncbi:MAG: hypothetical protein HY809_07155 [Nitrospirae bacterium]|nr:hypothetical protein [Nitrospirota bacterium]
MKKAIILFLLLLSAPYLAAQQNPETLKGQLALDNPRVINYLKSLDTSDAGEKLQGIKLSDGSVTLENHVFLETIRSTKKKFSVYLFRIGAKTVAYTWVEPNGKPLFIPPCPSDYGDEGQYVLSGDVYTWKDVQPGDGIIIIECVTDKWINEIKRTK